jgi:RNA recognition motif-containing protein
MSKLEDSNISNKKRLFVASLHYSTSEGDLIKLFQKYGNVVTVEYLWHKFGPQKGQPKGIAFVEMSTHDEASMCIAKLNGLALKSRQIRVSWAESHHTPTVSGKRGRHDDSSSSNKSGDGKRKAVAIDEQLRKLKTALHTIDSLK